MIYRLKTLGRAAFVALLASGSLAVFTAQAERPDIIDIAAVSSDKAATEILLNAARAGDRIVAVGERGHIVYSDDNGRTWSQASSPTIVTLTAVDFPTAERGWAVGHDAVVLTTEDGGQNWRRLTDGRELMQKQVEALEGVVAEAERALESATEDTRGDLEFALDDAIFALESVQAELEFGPTWPLLDVEFVSETEGWVVGAYGMIFQTKDGGETWTARAGSVPNPEGLHLNAIIQNAPRQLIIAAESGLLLHSPDGGRTFEQVDNPEFVSLFALESDGARGAYAVGFGGAVIKTSNGVDWQSVSNPVGTIFLGATRLEDGTLIAAGAGGITVAFSSDASGAEPTFHEGRHFYSDVIDSGDGALILFGETGAVRAEGPK